MRLLDVETEFADEKVRTQVTGCFGRVEGILSTLSGRGFSGYEIHMGRTEEREKPLTDIGGVQRGNVYGSYVHGIFDMCADAVINALAEKKGIKLDAQTDIKAARESEYDKLAAMLRKSLDMDYIYEIIKKEGSPR